MVELWQDFSCCIKDELAAKDPPPDLESLNNQTIQLDNSDMRDSLSVFLVQELTI